ncbi:MAG: glycosyl transferase [Candidatus Harrisonbacteria bacterium CG10_big_fil_rev_8_21_14_0_10_40_38]|uniref:Glycosyl transferase n=1 Tax=Candidatus Harrisonbacteria bacterium CG10_big_fil_rev_8_21_14_0_10_40_38 TaxID=1974583 RepID=A0A2H0UR90_9BACT|nr:MAG: glycosyl transferase [Candidatus Harrisonbacteria bacterium CG10_big_fil_rev_8_21_14_0_10_40_38]
MKLSIIIPAYNEESTIEELLNIVKKINIGDIEKEIIVVDDGSKDRTREILKNTEGIKYIFHEKNQGKGGAIKTGFKNATGDILLIQDADLEYDPTDYKAMIEPIIQKRSEVVLGVRIAPEHDARKRKSLYWLSWFGNHIITWTTNILYLNNAGEYEGCYKTFTRKAINDVEIKTNDFDFDNELVCKLIKKGYKTVDVPIKYYPRSYAEGKKINWRHGVKILKTIIKYRFID